MFMCFNPCSAGMKIELTFVASYDMAYDRV